jgi:hypothetical protein
MKINNSKKIGISFILGMIVFMGANNSASAQFRNPGRGSGARQSAPVENRGFGREDFFKRQQQQNQQRFDQRQQNYQSFHQQRMEQQFQNQPRTADRQLQNQQRQTDNQTFRMNRQARPPQFSDGEWQRRQTLQNNWDKSERNWQNQYDSRWQRIQDDFTRRSQLLQQQNRLSQYNFERAYWDRVREDHDRLQSWQFYNDAALDYYYLRGGQYYYTSLYGVNMLNDSINDGYQEGFLAGQADREDGAKYDFKDAFAYKDASYGYNGYWVDFGEYQYYFQKGFQDGYDDGYYNRSRYGSYIDGNYIINGSVLKGLVNFTLIGG